MKQFRTAAAAFCIAGLLATAPAAAVAAPPTALEPVLGATAAKGGQTASPNGMFDEINRIRCLLLRLC
ncbi:hypothetical protein [Pseudarthrobacter chlorophenolicus]|uniref:hypothetical protein n=1 Tax=Pseudarthrobacter chlorophenolicus TaxID=85085 RepID=UPI0005F28215|nr:hypothetical protein [Pseudarthrobacter chlorophenolicus]